MNIILQVVAIIISFLSLVATIFQVFKKYLQKRKGNFVIVERITDYPRITLPNTLSSGLNVTYKNRPIDDLYVYRFIIYNDGDINIKNLKITLILRSGNKELSVVDVDVIDPQELTRKIVSSDTPHRCEVEITRDYINMRKQYENELINVQIISSVELNLSILGGDEGWNVEYLWNERRNTYIRTSYYGFLAIGTLSALVAHFLISISYFKIILGILTGVAVTLASLLKVLWTKGYTISLEQTLSNSTNKEDVIKP